MQGAVNTLSCIFVGTFCVRARGAALKDLVEAGSTENEVCASNGAWLEPRPVSILQSFTPKASTPNQLRTSIPFQPLYALY